MQQLDKRICRKCKLQPSVIMMQKDPACRDCFIGHTEHQLKMTLRMKCQIIQKNELLLLCVSNGQNSAVMTKIISDIVHSTCAHNKNKMFLNADVLHIDESILGFEKSDMHKFVTEECKLKYTEVKLQSLFAKDDDLRELLQKLPAFGSAREDLVSCLKLHIIYRFAIENGYTKVCFAQNGQRLASDLFQQLSKGRGLSIATATKHTSQLQFPSQFFKLQAEEPSITLTILHPMKELMNKDILYYLRVKGNDKFPNFTLGQSLANQQQINKPANGSINHLLDDFIDKLQINFPATAFTVLSSAEKATLKPIEKVEYCAICLCQKDKVYNKLEMETLDNSNQALVCHLEQHTKYYTSICFTCKRMFQGSQQIEQIYNLECFPQNIVRIADLIREL